MGIRNELVEELLAGYDPSEMFTSDGVLDALKKASAERMLNAELDQHLASERAGHPARRKDHATTATGAAARRC